MLFHAYFTAVFLLCRANRTTPFAAVASHIVLTTYGIFFSTRLPVDIQYQYYLSDAPAGTRFLFPEALMLFPEVPDNRDNHRRAAHEKKSAAFWLEDVLVTADHAKSPELDDNMQTEKEQARDGSQTQTGMRTSIPLDIIL